MFAGYDVITVLVIYNFSLKKLSAIAGSFSDILNGLQESEVGIYMGEIYFYITDLAKHANITSNVLRLYSVDWTIHFIRTNDLGYSKIVEQLFLLGDLVNTDTHDTIWSVYNRYETMVRYYANI